MKKVGSKMKKLCSLIIAAVLLVHGFVWAGEPAVDSHPILSEKNWIYSDSDMFYLEDLNGDKVLFSEVKFYRANNGSYLSGVHYIFGEEVIRGYGVRDTNAYKLLGHWVQVEKDGQWYTSSVEEVNLEVVVDASGKIVAAVLVLQDKNGNEIVRREVKRK